MGSLQLSLTYLQSTRSSRNSSISRTSQPTLPSSKLLESIIMKSFIAAAAFVGSALAQSLSDLPQCGQTCINNMLAEAGNLGCPPVNGQPDAVRLCANANFGYGVRDCTRAVCPADAVNGVIDYGLQYCAGAASSASGSASGSALSATEALTATGSLGGAAGGMVTTIVSDGSTMVSTITDGAGAAGAIVTTIVSDGSTQVSTLTGSAASAAASATESGGSAASSATESAGSAASESASSASSGLSSASESASSEAGAASSEHLVPPQVPVRVPVPRLAALPVARAAATLRLWLLLPPMALLVSLVWLPSCSCKERRTLYINLCHLLRSIP